MHRLVAILAIALVGLDVVTTVHLLSTPGLHEANPLAQHLFLHRGQAPALIVRTVILTGAALVSMLTIKRRDQVREAWRTSYVRVAWTGLIVSCIAGLGASVNNIIHMGR